MKFDLENIKPRVEVRRFAFQMECVLRENDHKGGWDNSTEEYLTQRLFEELGEVFTSRDIHKKKKELVDVANFCMMLYGKLGV